MTRLTRFSDLVGLFLFHRKGFCVWLLLPLENLRNEKEEPDMKEYLSSIRDVLENQKTTSEGLSSKG